jgi:addiction module HigA family antidote
MFFPPNATYNIVKDTITMSCQDWIDMSVAFNPDCPSCRAELKRSRIRTADLERMQRVPVHPGEIFEEEYRKHSGMSQAEAARRMGMSANRLNEIVKGKRRVTPDTAESFSDLTNTSIRFWLELQHSRDLWFALKRNRRQ